MVWSFRESMSRLEVELSMPRDDKAEALLEMLIDVVWTAHKLRAAGAGEGAVNASGGGTWGV